MRTSLAFDTPFEDAVAAKMSGELAEAVACARDTGQPVEDRVHRARLAVKELRAFLRMARPALRSYYVLNVGLRDATRRLAHHRDSAVRTQLLAELFESAPPEAGIAEFASRIEELAGPPPGQAEQETELDAFCHDIAALAGNTALWRVEPKGWACLADGAALTYRYARQFMIAADKSGVPGDFHEWRKEVKYHSRQLALLLPLASGPSERRCKAMSELGEILGRHHDFEELALHLRNATSLDEDAMARFDAVIAPAMTGLERTALRVGKEKLRHKADRIRSTIAKALKNRHKTKIVV